MLAAGLVAKKAVERGLKVKPWVKTSLAPGSRVVSEYLEATGLQRPLDALGFALVGYSCTTCMGASGPIEAGLEKAINDNDAVACAVLSGNRNFEARIHPSVRGTFLMSPPLVVAFALAGRVDIDLDREPLGNGADGRPVYLKDIWPAPDELAGLLDTVAADQFRAVYGMDHAVANRDWGAIPQATGESYPWRADSTYIQEPPFLAPDLTESGLREFKGARALAILGNSITTDHISPIGNIKATSPAGLYLQGLGVKPVDFNNYGARRMNHEVMVRGTFANVRLRNWMVPGVEGGVTIHQPGGEQTSIYEAAMRYARDKVPLFVIAGEEYGTGSARDWAAKGTRLLGVRAVVAGSFERIHRSNLVGMGVLPCQLPAGVTAATLELKGDEEFDLTGLDANAKPRQTVTLAIRRRDGTRETVPLVLRLDTPAEVDYVRHGGIMPYILQRTCSLKASENKVNARNLSWGVMVALACGASALAADAAAQAWPARPIRLIVPFPPGGATDANARAIAKEMEPVLGQPLVIDNRGGANAIIGCEIAGQVRARRLHLDAHLRGVRDQPEHLQEAAIRHEPRLHPDHESDRRTGLAPRRERCGAREIGHRIDRAREKAEAFVRLARGRQRAAPHRRRVHGARGDRYAARAVQGRGTGLDGAARGRSAGDGGPRDNRASARQGRTTAAAGLQRREAAPGHSGRSDHRRGRPARLRAGHRLARLVRAAKTPAHIVTQVHAAIVKSLQVPALREFLVGGGYEPTADPPAVFQKNFQNDLKRWGELVRLAKIEPI